MPETTRKKSSPLDKAAKPKRTHKHNTPKPYPNKGTGKGKNPRKLCVECAENGINLYMNKVAKNYVIDGKLIIIHPLWFCKNKHVVWNDEELAKIPDQFYVPKKYPNKGTGEGKNPQMKCEECLTEGRERYMNKAAKNYVINGELVVLRPLWFCKYKHVVWNEEDLAKVPD